MFFSFWGSLVIGGIVAYLAEKWDLTHHGVVQAIIIALGGVILVFMVNVMFGLSFGKPGIDAIIGAAGALILIPSEVVQRRRNRRK